jgi:uncharacterized membrane protein
MEPDAGEGARHARGDRRRDHGLALAALREAPAAAVAAVRETSVIIAVAWLAVSGREEVTHRRVAGAVAVATGVALISAGGAA